jgi:hypothetical protein
MYSSIFIAGNEKGREFIMKEITWEQAKIGDCILVEREDGDGNRWKYSVFILDEKGAYYGGGKVLNHEETPSFHLDENYSVVEVMGAGTGFNRWKSIFLLDEEEKTEYYDANIILENLK